MERAADRVQHAAFERAAHRLRIDHQPAIVRADDALHPDAAGAAIDLDLGDLRDDGLTAVGVGDAATGEDLATADDASAMAACPT